MELPETRIDTPSTEVKPTTLADRNKQVETEYFKSANRLAKQALSEIGITVPSSDQFVVARNLLLYKGELTKAQRREQTTSATTQDLLLTVLRHSVRKIDSKDTKTLHPDCLIMTHVAPNSTTELHVFIPPYTDQTTDAGKVARFSPLVPIEALNQANRQVFLQNHGLKAHKAYDIHLHIAHTTELVDTGLCAQAQTMLTLLPEDQDLHIDFAEIPFSRDQVTSLQEKTDKLASQMPEKQVVVEIKSNKLARIVRESIKNLPDDSLLKILAQDASEKIAEHIIECLKDNSHPNLEQAQGYLFEALLALEVANPDSPIFSRIDRAINGKKLEDGRPTQNISLSSPTVTALNRGYVSFHSNAALHADRERSVIAHGDYAFIVGENELGVIECKSSPLPHLHNDTVKQLIATHDNAMRYIAWHNTQSTGLRLNTDKVHLFIVKPRSFETDADPKLPKTIATGVSVHTLNSSVEYGHLERVWRNIATEYNIKS